MQYYGETFDSVAENLAFDEALLLLADGGQHDFEALRLWQANSTFIVLGRSSKVAEEVNTSLAEANGVPVLRRVSGGATIVASHGCLFYALLLDLRSRPELRMIDAAHGFVMERMTESLQRLQPQLTFEGTCDLVVDGRKVSGNSVRVGRDWMLYHGTLLLNMDLTLLEKYLRHPPREPDYRRQRSHLEFVANMDCDAESVRELLKQNWEATLKTELRVESSLLEDALKKEARRLVAERYSKAEWNYQR